MGQPPFIPLQLSYRGINAPLKAKKLFIIKVTRPLNFFLHAIDYDNRTLMVI